MKQFSSYRSTFEIVNDKEWQTIRVPFRDFTGYGPGAKDLPFDPSTLRRLGIVAIGKMMDATLALSALRFYKEN